MSSAPLLQIEDLSVSIDQRPLVQQVGLTISRGERLALVGESGSGKSLTALSVLRLLPQAVLRGRVLWKGRDLLSLPESALQAVRGGQIGMVFQEPMTALNPVLSVRQQLTEALAPAHRGSSALAQARLESLLEDVGLAESARILASYPHQLSGGQRQRVLIAMALAGDPEMLIADEPTTALDMSLRQQILELLVRLQDERGLGLLIISHDLPMVRRFAHRVAVMGEGRILEQGPVEEMFERPQHPTTQALIHAAPPRMVSGSAPKADPLLQVRDLSAKYSVRSGFFGRRWRTALEPTSFSLSPGETLGVVGESGSGKSTLAMALLRLSTARVSGQVHLLGQSVLDLAPRPLRDLRAKMQPVFQDPYSALSPRRNVLQILSEGLALHFPDMSQSSLLNAVVGVLAEVGLPSDCLGRYPHEFSGGQRQRLAIARALLLKPSLMVLDEPTSALDLTVQRQVLECLVQLQERYGLAYVLISHDLHVVRAMTHRVLVLRHGRVVESGPTEEVLHSPREEYTRQLLDAAFPERLDRSLP